MTSQDLQIAVARDLYEAFNLPTVDGAMEYFADDVIYEDPMGRRHEGRTAVRAALAPAFSGAQRYQLENLYDAGDVVVATWNLETGPVDSRVCLTGMDILKFSGRKIELKQCFMKASGLLTQPVSR